MTGSIEQFNGRHIIGPDTEVLGGVLPTQTHGAIVVDFAENPQVYEMGYRSVENRLSRGKTQPPPPIMIAGVVNQVVKELLPFDYAGENALLNEEAMARGLESIGPDDEVELSRFIGGGACQHQTLFGASLLALLQERQDIGGTVSVRMESPETDPRGVRQHTWTRYTNGRRIIIDSAVYKAPVFAIEGMETPIDTRKRFYLTEEELLEMVEERDLVGRDIRRLDRVGLRASAA